MEHLKRHSGTHSASLQAGRHQLGGPSVSFLGDDNDDDQVKAENSLKYH